MMVYNIDEDIIENHHRLTLFQNLFHPLHPCTKESTNERTKTYEILSLFDLEKSRGLKSYLYPKNFKNKMSDTFKNGIFRHLVIFISPKTFNESPVPLLCKFSALSHIVLKCNSDIN